MYKEPVVSGISNGVSCATWPTYDCHSCFVCLLCLATPGVPDIELMSIQHLWDLA